MSEFKKIGQIIEGHFNKQLDKAGLLKDDTKRMAELRFAYCLLCHVTPAPGTEAKGPGMKEGNRCRVCNCDMEAKTKVVDAKCPIGRW